MQVIKRDGSKVDFKGSKIYDAIVKAASEVYVLDDQFKTQLAEIAYDVVLDLKELQIDNVTISMIQSQVEQRLISAGLITVAERYISYRLQRDLERYGFGERLSVHLHFEKLA